MPKKRPRKASLRGWWHVLPFLLPAFAVFIAFTWLEAQRLKNEYRANSLATEIWEVRANIQKLKEQSHHLNRMERMEQHAPSLDLLEAEPDQIVYVELDGAALEAAWTSARNDRDAVPRPTRSVVFDFNLSVPPARDVLPGVVAQAARNGREHSGG